MGGGLSGMGYHPTLAGSCAFPAIKIQVVQGLVENYLFTFIQCLPNDSRAVGWRVICHLLPALFYTENYLCHMLQNANSCDNIILFKIIHLIKVIITSKPCQNILIIHFIKITIISRILDMHKAQNRPLLYILFDISINT